MQILIWAQKVTLTIFLRNTQTLKKTFENVLNAHAPKETKFLRGNQKPRVDKNLCKAIMKCSLLKNKPNRTKQLEDITKYKKQQNLVVKLSRE